MELNETNRKKTISKNIFIRLCKFKTWIKQPVGDRIFFVGEATAYAYSTVHGADRSGRRAVGQLINSPALKS